MSTRFRPGRARVRDGSPRVLHLSPVPFGVGGTFGGGERFPVELARAMAELTPTTFASFADTASTHRDGALTDVRLPIRRRVAGSDLNPLSEQLVPLIARHDVVHVHQWETVYGNVAVTAARALGKRVFVTDHGGATPNHRRRLRLHRIVRASLNVSDFAGTFYPEFGTRNATIFGGVDVRRFAPDPDLERGRHALFVGRLMPHKGVDVLVDAVAPDFPLHLMGRPYDAAYLRLLQEKARGKDVTFVLEADDDEVLRAYQQARCVVLPSLHHPVDAPAAPKAELLGLTLIEAMACGTPVVCTATGGMPEVVDDGRTGRVVPQHDPRALREALELFVSDDTDWATFSAAARQRVIDTFTWTAVARRCLTSYAA